MKFLTIFSLFGIISIYQNDCGKKIPTIIFHKHSGGRVNKLELIKNLKEEGQISKNEAAAIVDLFFNKISDALAEGDRVEIRGLCSFFVKEYNSYTGRNPRTGKKVQVDRKRLPFFKVGKELKERVDY
jgi:integration host factor subunit beta